MPIDASLLEILICPQCHASLREREDAALECKGCRRIYPVRDGIPVLLVEESVAPDAGDGRS